MGVFSVYGGGSHWIINGNNLSDPYLPRDQQPSGREGKGWESAKICRSSALDPQRSANSTAWELCTVKDKTADYISSSLCLNYILLHLLLNSTLIHFICSDPCKTDGCNAPYNTGCRVVDNAAECICPTCPDTVSPVCTSDDVQDRSECLMRKQSCVSGDLVTVAKSGPCGM